MGRSKKPVSPGIIRIQSHGFLCHLTSQKVPLSIEALAILKPSQKTGIGLKVVCAPGNDKGLFSLCQFHLQCGYDLKSYLILKSKNVLQFTVVSFCPEMSSVQGIDQLDTDSHPFFRFSNTAFKHVLNPKVLAHLLNFYGLSFVDKAGVSGDHEQPGYFGKGRDDLLGQTIGKIFLFWIAAHVQEGQHSNRRFVGKGLCHPVKRSRLNRGGTEVKMPDSRSRSYNQNSDDGNHGVTPGLSDSLFRLNHSVGRSARIRQNPICPDRFINILDLMLAQKLIFKTDLVFDGIVDCPRDTYLPSLSQALHSRRDIHPVPVNSVSLFKDISQVDADPELHPTVLRQLGVSLGQLPLDLHGAVHRIHHAGKLSQHIVPGGVYHPASVLLNQAGHGCPVGGDGADGGFLIVLHEAAVSLHIRTQNGCEPAFEALFRHGITSLLF